MKGDMGVGQREDELRPKFSVMGPSHFSAVRPNNSPLLPYLVETEKGKK